MAENCWGMGWLQPLPSPPSGSRPEARQFVAIEHVAEAKCNSIPGAAAPSSDNRLDKGLLAFFLGIEVISLSSSTGFLEKAAPSKRAMQNHFIYAQLGRACVQIPDTLRLLQE